MIHKKLKFRQYDYKTSYQKQSKSKLISSSKSYQSQKGNIRKEQIKEKFKVFRKQIKTSKSYQPSLKSRLNIKVSSSYPNKKISYSTSYPNKKYQGVTYQPQPQPQPQLEPQLEPQPQLESQPQEEKPYREPHRHQTDIYECTCIVSDRKLQHLFACQPVHIDIFGSFEALHNDSYPDHQLISYEWKNVFTIEDKGTYNNNYPTEKQKDFLKHLGYSKEAIKGITTKQLATEMITKAKR